MTKKNTKKKIWSRDMNRVLPPQLMRGIMNNDFVEVTAALKLNAEDINGRESGTGLTPLHIAVGYNLREMTLFLVNAHGANIQLKDAWNRDALDLALQLGHHNISDDLFAALANKSSHLEEDNGNIVILTPKPN